MLNFILHIKCTSQSPGSKYRVNKFKTHSCTSVFYSTNDVALCFNHLLLFQAAFSAGTSSVLEFSGSMVIPRTADTQPFCWKRVYLGIWLDSSNIIVNETNENNNAAFYKVIFDCGGKMSYFAYMNETKFSK